MSSLPGSSHLRAGIAQALAIAIDDLGASEVARLVGVDRSTPARRGSDLHQWPASDLLSFACAHDDLRAAIVAYMIGDDLQRGDSMRVVPEILESIRVGSLITAHSAEVIRDGRLTQKEAARLLKEMKDRRNHEDRVLIPALRAIANV
jgi:hypothetical protein